MQEEPIDENFLPVFVDFLPKYPSRVSLQTVLNELHYCNSLNLTSNHTSECSSTSKSANDNVSCLLDIAQGSDTDSCDEHLQEQQNFMHSLILNNEQDEEEHMLCRTERPRFLTTLLDPKSNMYNISLDSRDYVQFGGTSYIDSGSTILTIVTNDNDSCEQRLSCDDD